MDMIERPFINVEGIFNFRYIGGYAIDRDSLYPVRRGIIFRCANTGKITSNGMQQIRDLGITTIFDLRSASEIERTQDYAPTTNIPGVKRVHVSLFDGEYPDQQTVESLKNNAADNLRVRSLEIAVGSNYHKADRENNRSAHMLDFSEMESMPSEPSLLTYETIPTKAASSFAMAEKNRTGVAVAFILAAAGVDYSTIKREYMLTKEGLEPIKDSLFRYLSEKSGTEWTKESVSGLLRLKPDELNEMNDTLKTMYDGAEG